MKNATYNLKSIMTRAWAIARETAVKASCKVSEVYFSDCLKMAWAEAEGVNAEVNANKIVREWSALGESGQCKMMTACIRKAAKNEIAYSTEDHYLQFSEVPAFSLFRAHDFDEFLSETTIRLLDNLSDTGKLVAKNEERAAQGKRPLTLVSLVYNAARASIAAVYYQDGKHGAAYDIEIDDGEGNTASYLETMVGSDGTDTERSAIIRADMGRYVASRDKVDQKIMELLPQGFTERQIGAIVGMSGVAIHKRIAKMRRDLGYLQAA